MSSQAEVGLRAAATDLLVERIGPYYSVGSPIIVAVLDEWVDRSVVEVAVVVSVGPEVKEDVHEGQQVLIGRYGGDADFSYAGKEYTRCQVTDVLAVLPVGL